MKIAGVPFRTDAIDQAAGTDILEQHGRLPFADHQHLSSHLPDFPLCVAAGPEAEEVPQLPGIHGDHQISMCRVGQNIACVFIRDPERLQIFIDGPAVVHDPVEFEAGLRLVLDGMGRREILPRGGVSLRLLGKGCQAVSDQLMGQGATDPFHQEGKRDVLEHRQVAPTDHLPDQIFGIEILDGSSRCADPGRLGDNLLGLGSVG